MNKTSFSAAFTRYFIESPLTSLLLLTMLLLGTMALVSLPREEEPQISVPMVDVFIKADGLKAIDAVELVTKPLEVILKAIPEVDHIYSQTEDDQVIVTLRFNVGANSDDAILRVHERIRAHIQEIPYGIPMPVIVGRGIDDVAIMVITIYPEKNVASRWNDVALYELAQKLQKEIIKINDIGTSYIVGGRPEQIRIEPLPDKLLLHNITINQLVEKIENSNFTGVSTQVTKDNKSLVLEIGTNLKNYTDLGLLVVADIKGKTVYLKDLANIINDGKPVNSRAWFKDKVTQDFIPAVSLAISKRNGANAVDIVNEVNKRLQLIHGSLLPKDVKYSVTRDYGKIANDKSNRLLEDLLGATLSVVFLVSLMIGWREGIVVLMVIPATILSTLFVSWMLGFTINRVSLFALIFSIGILVDDAIVFIENIVRRWRQDPDLDKVNTAINAVVEVGNPTILATLTIVIALLPMLFVSGLMGPYMSPIPINASVAMLISLFVAFSIVPWFLLKFHDGIVNSNIEKQHRDNWISFLYRKLVTQLVFNRDKCRNFLLITAISTLLVLGLFFSKSVVVKMLPFDNKSEIAIQVDLREGSTLEDTERTLRQIANSLSDLPELKNLQMYVGLGAPFNFNGLVKHSYLREKVELGELQLNLLDKDDRDRESHSIAIDIRSRLKKLNLDSTIAVKVLEVPPGPPVLSTLLAEIYGPDADSRRNTAIKIKEIFAKVDFITDIDDSFGELADRINISADKERLDFYGVDEKELITNVKTLFSSNRIGYSKRGDGKYPIEISIELPKDSKVLNDRILTTPINSKRGVIEIGSVLNIKNLKSSYKIFRHNSYDVDMVMAELNGRFEAPIYGMLEVNKIIETQDWPKNNKPVIRYYGQPLDESAPVILWDGEWEITYVTFRDMGIAFFIAILGIYGILVAQFKSYKTPLAVLLPVPLVLLGIILGHWILGAAFTATSMIGMIALSGIVVRNSLLLVEFIRHGISGGFSLQEALIEAGATRITPIILTAIAAMTGAVFMFFDPIFQGLAISLFFGLMSSTVLTLFAIPALYVIVKTHK